MVRFNSLLTAITIALSGSVANAEDKLLPPPWVLTGFDTIVTGVTWDEAAIKKALPPGVLPTREMTGGINVYTVSNATGIGAYTAAYFWVDLDGMDTANGTKGRWLLAGVYGPSEKAKNTFEQYLGLSIRTGSARHENGSDGVVRAIGSIGGQDLVVVEAKVDMTKCAPAGQHVNFLSQLPNPGYKIAFSVATLGEVCPAEAKSVKVTAPAGDPLAQFQPVKVNWSARFRGNIAVAPTSIRP